MSPKFKFDTKNFSLMVRDLSNRTGASLHDVLRFEVSRILASASEKTRAAQAGKIRRSINARPFVSIHKDKFSPESWGGKSYRKGTWRGSKKQTRVSNQTKYTKAGYVRYPTGKSAVKSGRTSPEWRYPRVLWKMIQDQNKASIEKRLRARGTAKKSWWQLAHSLNLNFLVPQYVAEAATYPKMDVSSEQIRRKESSFIILRNLVRAAASYHGGGYRALRNAINGRVTSWKKGVENRVAEVVRGVGGTRGVTVKKAA